MILGINASRARSGGARVHLVEILREVNLPDFGISEVHVWSYPRMLLALPEVPWLFKHQPPELECSLLYQLCWEKFSLPVELRKTKCSLLLNVDAGSICRFRPAVSMSRDMLSYEAGEIKRYGISMSRLRLIALRYIQNASLKTSDGVVFLTRYAAQVIQLYCGAIPNIAYIPHGVSTVFKDVKPAHTWPFTGERSIRCLYVSNTAFYKHQWHVVEAITRLRQRGFNLRLELVGGGDDKAQLRLESQIAELDPNREFVEQREFVPQHTLPSLLSEADLFVFASSCENMPNTLLEAMAAGLPIACSNRGPMPEVLEDAGVYFDPEEPSSIAAAIEDLIIDTHKRTRLAERAKELSLQYSWSRCAFETFSFITKVFKQVNQEKKCGTILQ